MKVYKEKIYPINEREIQTGEHIFLRFNLEETPDYYPNAYPMLFQKAPELNLYHWNEDFLSALLKSHVDAALRLKQKGYTTCVLAADNDGYLQKSLSPRFNNKIILERMESICNIYEALKIIIEDTWVLITIEELAPGGFDATDGVMLAQKLESLGLNNLIVSAGTRDFLPLYNPRQTQKKREEDENFYSHEPALASTRWALEHTDLSVWSLSFIKDYIQALNLGKELGLAGMIDKFC